MAKMADWDINTDERYTEPEEKKMPRGRPAKKEFKGCSLEVVANGYKVVPSNGTHKGAEFVFQDLEQVHEFIKSNMESTLIGKEFLKKV